jgi:hypothetical protein
MGLINKLFGKNKTAEKPKEEEKPFEFNAEPDFPQPFGYKIEWLAIKNETSQSVIEKLGLEIINEANWTSGISYVYDYNMRSIFVSPVLDNYILVIMGDSGEANTCEKLIEYAEKFGEFQYFGNHRVSDCYAWAKFSGKEIVRAYFYRDSELEVKGKITEEEISLGFAQFPQTENYYEEDKEYKYPDEENVFEIAGAWSINPAFENHNYEKSTGFACRFKQ